MTLAVELSVRPKASNRSMSGARLELLEEARPESLEVIVELMQRRVNAARLASPGVRLTAARPLPSRDWVWIG